MPIDNLFFLAEATPVAGVDTVVTTLQGTFTPAALGTTLSAVVGGAAALALAYFGIRKAVKVLWAAFSRGKLRI